MNRLDALVREVAFLAAWAFLLSFTCLAGFAIHELELQQERAKFHRACQAGEISKWQCPAKAQR